MKNLLLMLSVLFALTVMGCAKKIDLGPGYERMSRDFQQALRWKDFQGAAAYLNPENRQEFLARFSNMKDLYVVDVEYQYSRLNREKGIADSELILKYYLLPSTRVKDWVWKLDWVLLPVDTKQRGTWQVQTVPPSFP